MAAFEATGGNNALALATAVGAADLAEDVQESACKHGPAIAKELAIQALLAALTEGLGGVVDRVAAEGGVPVVEDLVAAARKVYPNKAGVTELHHSTPKYLGGAANGPRVPLDAAYHQQITNAFRDAWKYGQAQPPAAQVQQIMRDVYSKYPLPPGY